MTKFLQALIYLEFVSLLIDIVGGEEGLAFKSITGGQFCHKRPGIKQMATEVMSYINKRGLLTHFRLAVKYVF